MSISLTIIYVLIGVGVVACIVALIYTKIIKPNTFGYTKKNSFEKQSYNKLILKLNSISKVYSYENLTLIFEKQKPIIIERLFVTTQNVFMVSRPIEKSVLDIEIKNEADIKLIYKNKKLDLPLDINLMLTNYKLFKKQTNLKQNAILIIPFLNKTISNKKINNIHFVEYESLYDYIIKIDEQPSELNWKDVVAIIEKYMMKQKPKRTFMNIKFNKNN